MAYNVIGICNLHDNPRLGELTATRPIGAVSFLGRYGLVDFTLSNFSNSGIDRIFVLVEYGALQMRKHIRSGQIWIRNTKTGFISLNMNEKGLSNLKYNTDIANINETVPIHTVPSDYVVVAPSFFISSIDYSDIIKEHIENKRDITVVYSHRTDAKKEYLNCDEVTIDEKGRVNNISRYEGKTSSADISLETFIFSKQVFLRLLKEAKDISVLYTIRQMVTYYATHKEAKINIGAFKFNGYVAPILSLDHYVRHSFALLDYANRVKLFKNDWPIYTTTHDTQPTYYGEKANVKNSFIANGSVIEGKVENSILSRHVRVREGASVKNSILFNGTDVGKDINVTYVLSDKCATFREQKNISGKEDKALFVRLGAKV